MHVYIVVSFFNTVTMICRGDIMNQKQFVELLAALKKLEIDNNPNLSDYEKELCKQMVDEIKKKANGN